MREKYNYAIQSVPVLKDLKSNGNIGEKEGHSLQFKPCIQYTIIILVLPLPQT